MIHSARQPCVYFSAEMCPLLIGHQLIVHRSLRSIYASPVYDPNCYRDYKTTDMMLCFISSPLCLLSPLLLLLNLLRVCILLAMSRNHTALAYQPQDRALHSSVSPPLARAFDGFFGPPAREQASAPTSPDGLSAAGSSEYRRESQAQLPSYSVFGRST